VDKKVNSIVFILGATLFNVVVAVASFFILLVLYARFLMVYLPEDARSWGLVIIFVSAILISFFVYRAALKYLLAKIDVEKYFDPLFVRQNLKKKN